MKIEDAPEHVKHVYSLAAHLIEEIDRYCAHFNIASDDLVRMLGVLGGEFLARTLRRQKELGGSADADSLREYYYSTHELVSQVFFETAHSLALNREEQQRRWWKQEVPVDSETAFVAYRDRLFPNRRLTDEEWEAVKAAEE